MAEGVVRSLASFSILIIALPSPARAEHVNLSSSWFRSFRLITVLHIVRLAGTVNLPTPALIDTFVQVCRGKYADSPTP
jgi:hypothetical protein